MGTGRSNYLISRRDKRLNVSLPSVLTTALFRNRTHIPTFLDGKDLLRNNRQHLQIDPVELIEAGPGTARSESLEELAQRNVIQTVGAVEHDALLRNSLRKILGGFCFAGSSWTLGGSTQIQVQCTEQRPEGEGLLMLLLWGDLSNSSIKTISSVGDMVTYL